MAKISKYFIILLITIFLSSCSKEVKEFVAGDLKEDFCATHINYQYCECAFNSEFCEPIAKNPSEAEEYVKEMYDIWVNKEKLVFKNKCIGEGAIYKNEQCKYCSEGKTAIDGKCKNKKEEPVNETNIPEGSCRSDSDCLSECEGNTMWTHICNKDTKECEKSYDTDCSVNMETFGDLRFSMVCEKNDCSRDVQSIKEMRMQLELELEEMTQNSENAIKKDALLQKFDEICKKESDFLEASDILLAMKEFREFSTSTSPELVFESEENLETYNKLYIIEKETELEDIEDKEIILCKIKDYLGNLNTNDINSEELKNKKEEIESKLERLPILN